MEIKRRETERKIRHEKLARDGKKSFFELDQSTSQEAATDEKVTNAALENKNVDVQETETTNLAVEKIQPMVEEDAFDSFNKNENDLNALDYEADRDDNDNVDEPEANITVQRVELEHKGHKKSSKRSKHKEIDEKSTKKEFDPKKRKRHSRSKEKRSRSKEKRSRSKEKCSRSRERRSRDKDRRVSPRNRNDKRLNRRREYSPHRDNRRRDAHRFKRNRSRSASYDRTRRQRHRDSR